MGAGCEGREGRGCAAGEDGGDYDRLWEGG